MTDLYQQIVQTLSRCKRVLITTHIRPDGDALGTAAAMVLGMKKLGIESQVLLLSQLPPKYAFVFQENGIVYHDVEQGWPPQFPFESFDALLVLDTGTWSQLPGLKERIEHWSAAKIIIDHHLTQEDWGDIRLVVKEAAAAGEIVAELLQQWQIELDRPMACALFLAIASDTGWFQFSNTRPLTMRLAARLMEVGVDTDRMYRMLYQNETAQRVALQTRAMESLQLLCEGRLAVMTLGKEDFQATGAGLPDTENLINIPLQICSVQVSVMVTEQGDDGPIRVSFRSKGAVDVARFAEEFGGGGHARAAGAKLKGRLPEVRDRVVAALTAVC